MHQRADNSWTFLDTSVERSFLWSLALTMLPNIAAFAISLIIARWAGETVWGTVSWTMAFATAVLIIGKLGLGLGASRLASDYGKQNPGDLRELLGTALGLRVGVTVVVAVATAAFAAPIAGWFGDASLTWPVRVGAIIVVCASVYEFYEHFLIGLNRHATVSKVRSVTLLARVAFTAVVVAVGWGATEVLSGYVVAWAIGIATFAAMLYRFLPTAAATLARRDIRRRLLAVSIPLAVSSASVTIYSQMDKLMLGYFDSVEEVGQYSIARAVTEVSLFPAFAFVMTLRPALASRYSSGALEDCARLIRNSLRMSLVAGVMLASIFAVMAVPLLTTVYSETYRYAGELMALFVWVIGLRSLGVLVLPALVAAERTRVYAYLTTFSAVMNFVLNLVLIPSLHARGAVLATIVSYAVLLVAGLYQVFRIFRVRLGFRALGIAVRTVLAGAVAGTILWFILDRAPGPGWSIVLWALVQAVVYGVLVVLFRVVRWSDIRLMLGNLLKTKA